ncbi:MAG: SUMF1/EgtB/PvdO family nonheme iron enzyme [Gammaproteobacteria bacterium]|nr:SUMF1/EgtB/PvdO family nonheme iron enzyme [Gammaproteobacteria bacterium]
MNRPALLDELRLAQDLVMTLIETLQDDSYHQQFHPDLSPLGWHLGHCTYTECYWLQEVVLGDNRYTAPVAGLYTPASIPKPERGAGLPPLDVLVQWVLGMQSLNAEIFDTAPTALLEHPLMQDDYLIHFLIQHYSQHYETMLAVLTQRTLHTTATDFQVTQPFTALPPRQDRISVQPGHFRVGGLSPVAYDNELPSQQATLGPYDIARNPVSNSEYLAFMEDGGYTNESCWGKTGWQWRQQQPITGPEHWRRDSTGNWYGMGVRGAYELDGTDALHGIAQYEAAAYASWAGGQLPHEHQWEVARRLQLLEQTGRVWEWCQNRFYPYAGFQPFPYKEYSQPWFNNNHYTLRGGSLHTRPAIKRVSFRNFHTPEKRHIFAGLRLVY